eukprot:8411251-Alexandrium_andersonii.AAC.1
MECTTIARVMPAGVSGLSWVGSGAREATRSTSEAHRAAVFSAHPNRTHASIEGQPSILTRQ